MFLCFLLQEFSNNSKFFLFLLEALGLRFKLGSAFPCFGNKLKTYYIIIMANSVVKFELCQVFSSA
jgi:hypothetical protein